MSQVHQFSGDKKKFSWVHVVCEELNEEGLESVTKSVLVGEKENAPNFIMRYFRVGAQGHSRLERHPQEHEIIVMHGKGVVQIGEESHDIKPFDVVFIEGNELHQFRNPYQENFGFICIIPNPSRS